MKHEGEENKDGGDNVVYDDDDNEGGVLGDEAEMLITHKRLLTSKKPKEDLKSLTIRMRESLRMGLIKAQSVMMSEVMVMNHLQRWWTTLDDPPTSISFRNPR